MSTEGMLQVARSRAVAHRGRLRGDPEQALSSLRRLPPWVSAVEVDVRISADGVPVLMHDDTVDRTTDGGGAVAGLRAAEIAALTLLPDERVPTLAAYLRACESRGVRDVYLHLKVSRPAAIGAVMAVVRDAGHAERCVLLFGCADRALEAHERTPELRLGLLSTTRRNLEGRVELAHAGVVWLLLTPRGDERYLAHRDVVAAARAAGVRTGASTLRRAPAHRAALEDGCEMLITDSAHRLDGADASSWLSRQAGTP